MVTQVLKFWQKFKHENQKDQIILVLIIVVIVSNWYQYDNSSAWIERNINKQKKIDELEGIIGSNAAGFNTAITDLQKEYKDCQEQRILEHKERNKKDSLVYIQTDRLYQQVNKLLTPKETR